MLYFPSNANLNGILRYLSKNKKFYKAEVTAIGSSRHIYNNWSLADVILDQRNAEKASDCWCSEKTPYQYDDIDFKIHYVRATSFSIKTVWLNKFIIRNFTLQGSNSTDDFVDIHRHDGTNLTNGIANVFNCQSNGTYNHFRIKMLDTTADRDDWFFIICAVEFFGYVTDLSLYQTCLHKRCRIINNAVFIFIFEIS